VSFSSKIRDHIRSNVVGYLALFIALTIAPAWAASIGAPDIQRNAVRSKHIKAENVRGSDLGANVVNSGKIADDAVTFGKIAADAVTGFEIDNGSLLGEEFRFSGKSTENFPTIAGNNCARVDFQSQPGTLGIDHVVVTPPPEFPDTFTLTGKLEGVDPGTSRIVFVACNVFDAGSVDPDGGDGGDYAFLVIDDD
jgi:hypothetical protein